MSDNPFIGLYHDIGKIGVSTSTLSKPKGEKLTSEEWEEVKTHPDFGFWLITNHPELIFMLAGIEFHHENYNGTGYPRCLAGRDIPHDARLIRVADTYETMTSGRIYKRPMTHEEACEELRLHSGTLFDPKIVECFLDNNHSFKDLLEFSSKKV